MPVSEKWLDDKIHIFGFFDKLNRSLPQNFNEINAGLSKLQGRLASQEADGASNADVETPPMAGGPQSPESAEAPAGPAADAKPGAAPQMSPQPRKKPVPAASPSYQRIESADGLVRYKKIK